MFCIQKTGFQFAEIYSVLSNYIKFNIFAETYIMKRALIYLLAGTLISSLLNYFLLGSQGWALDLYYGFAFGAATHAFSSLVLTKLQEGGEEVCWKRWDTPENDRYKRL